MPKPSSRRPRAGTRSAVSPRPRTEQLVGRGDAPEFVFEPLRIGLLEQLVGPAGLVRKVIGIVAPVGYGKTVLMSLLMADLKRAGKQCLWFALDERDTSTDAVISGLRALLQTRPSKLHPTQALFSGDESIDRRIDALVDSLNRYPLPITLFVDNLHYCSEPAFGRLLDRLCFATRASVSLVFSSTRELPLNQSRATLEGLLRVVGPAELSFGSDEVARLLGPELCAALGKAGVASVVQRTEGWPAATRMAQIILSGSAEPRTALEGFSGSDEGLAYLLNRQVLSGFSPEAREFLLTISLLRTFCLDLCRLASGDARAAEWLDDLVQRKVFIIPLDRNGGWYRLHGLFRDFLIREAGRVLSDHRRRAVLRRAALWCERQGYWREAVDYALAAESASTACQILERIAQSFVRDRGDVLQYIRWIEALHDRKLEAGPEAEFWYVWALAFRRRYDPARQHSARLSARLATQDGDTATLQRRLQILRISIDSLSDHLHDAHAGASQWLAAARDDDDPFNVAAASCIECGYHSSHFRFAEARRAIQGAREAAFQTGSAYVAGWVSAYAALAPILEGDCATAYPALITAFEAAREALGGPAGIGSNLALLAARCAIDMGLSSEARQLVQYGLGSVRHHGFIEATALGLEAAVLLWDGVDDEVVRLATLHEIAAAYPPRLAQMLSCFLIRRLLELGRVQDARDEAARLGLGPPEALAVLRRIPQMRELIAATELELLIADGRHRQAEALITAALAEARREGRQARLVELTLLRSQLAGASQRDSLLRRDLVQAIRIATPRRIVRPFLRHADALASTLAGLKPGDVGLASVDEQRFFNELCGRLASTKRGPSAEAGGARDAEPKLLGKLTRKELELLRLLATGLSNQQVADHSEVSVTTIKWHLQNLYAKLNVSSRSAALAQARLLNLLGS